jgi:hypothetical protein
MSCSSLRCSPQLIPRQSLPRQSPPAKNHEYEWKGDGAVLETLFKRNLAHKRVSALHCGVARPVLKEIKQSTVAALQIEL